MRKSGETSGRRLAISEGTLQQIYEYIGKHPAERGGMLGSDTDGVIRYFVPDRTARCSVGAYDPDIAAMNAQIKSWKADGIRFNGFVHSHPPGCRRLSPPDEEYATRILGCFKSLDWLALPLVMTEADTGRFEVLPFIAVPDAKVRAQVSFEEAELEVERNSEANGVNGESQEERKGVDLSKGRPGGNGGIVEANARETALTVSPQQKPKSKTATADAGNQAEGGTLTSWRYHGDFPSAWRQPDLRRRGCGTHARVEVEERVRELQAAEASRAQATRYLDCVQTAYDLSVLDNTRLVEVGAGGAASLIRDLARAGVGESVLIDPDEITESNIGSQAADPRKIGKPKVEALAQEIRTINPASALLAMSCKIEDITDQDFEVLMKAPLRYWNHAAVARVYGSDPLGHPRQPGRVILLGLTDNFEAQARVHRLGLQYGVPTICAQEYREGVGAEITWTVPDVTSACHRCMTSSRYQAYLKEGYQNDVTSHGAPIFSAQMLNAVLGHIILAVAHHGTKHPRYGNLVRRMGNRNMVLLRMEPDFDNFMGRSVFGRRLAGAAEPGAFFMLDSLFVAQTPDCGQTESRPVCPDCGGAGDLRRAAGTFSDTRLMREKFPEKQ